MTSETLAFTTIKEILYTLFTTIINDLPLKPWPSSQEKLRPFSQQPFSFHHLEMKKQHGGKC